jgi:hypothetical protein
MNEQISRIKAKLAKFGVPMNPPLNEQEVEEFERQHGITLPDGYRRFIIEVGNGGHGPAFHGLVRLGDENAYGSMNRELNRFWGRAPFVARPFPFTSECFFDDTIETSVARQHAQEGTREQMSYGNIFLGSDGCRMDWHLIVAGLERGNVWQFGEFGPMPTKPKKDFLRWYEDWLDGPKPLFGLGYSVSE